MNDLRISVHMNINSHIDGWYRFQSLIDKYR